MLSGSPAPTPRWLKYGLLAFVLLAAYTASRNPEITERLSGAMPKKTEYDKVFIAPAPREEETK